MSPYLKPLDRTIILGVAVSLLTLSIIGWLVIGQFVLVFVIVVIAVLLLALQLVAFRRLDLRLYNGERAYLQTEALFSLFSVVQLRYPLPPMRGWAISPDFANVIVSLIQERKPKLVVEASSGISTIITAYCLEALGEGRVISLEHDAHFAALSTSLIHKHGLNAQAQVIHAPLKRVSIGCKSWQWYDLVSLPTIQSIDMLIVDGPPADGHEITRYPALPILFDQLSSDAVVLLDDANRPEEKSHVTAWLTAYREFDVEEVPTEKGAVILRRHPQRRHVESVRYVGEQEMVERVWNS